MKTQAVKWDGRTHAVDLTLPGMTAMFFLFKACGGGEGGSSGDSREEITN